MLRKLTIAFFSSCLFVLMAVALLFWMQREVLEQPLQIDSEQVLAVPAGSTPNGLLLQLEQQGALRGAFWLRLSWRLQGYSQALHAGEYQLTEGMKVAQLLEKWRSGDVAASRATRLR